jgi:hypothetical protein
VRAHKAPVWISEGWCFRTRGGDLFEFYFLLNKQDAIKINKKMNLTSKMNRVFLFLDGSGWQLGAKDFGRQTA